MIKLEITDFQAKKLQELLYKNFVMNDDYSLNMVLFSLAILRKDELFRQKIIQQAEEKAEKLTGLINT